MKVRIWYATPCLQKAPLAKYNILNVVCNRVNAPVCVLVKHENALKITH